MISCIVTACPHLKSFRINNDSKKISEKAFIQIVDSLTDMECFFVQANDLASPKEILAKLINRNPHLKILKWCDYAHFDELDYMLLAQLPCLTSLDLRLDHLHHDINPLDVIVKSCPQLEHLSIKCDNYSMQSIAPLAHLTNLTSLALDGYFDVNPTVIETILNNNSHLEQLTIKIAQPLSRESLELMAQKISQHKNIREFVLQYYENKDLPAQLVSDAHFRELVSRAPLLEKITLPSQNIKISLAH